MPVKDLFESQFGEGTKLKLKIYKDYLFEWLPVFVAREKLIWNKVQILDFFSGRGKDLNGEKGSPLIAIDVVNSYENLIKAKNVNIELHFNELDKGHYDALKHNLESERVNPKVIITVENKPFKDILREKMPSFNNAANLLFIDQNGISQVDQEVFNLLTSFSQTDFLFFISSGYFKRFAFTPEFSRFFPSLNPKEISEANYYHVHRKVLEYYKTLIPAGKQYFLAPFSIKKGANIYGLIFGSSHTLGIEKFLKVAWQLDRHSGDSNYDIDGDRLRPGEMVLFEEMYVPKKKDLFYQSFEEQILSGKIETNYEAYLYTLNEGFLPKHANEILRRLKSQKKIGDNFKMVSEKIHKLKEIPERLK